MMASNKQEQQKRKNNNKRQLFLFTSMTFTKSITRPRRIAAPTDQFATLNIHKNASNETWPSNGQQTEASKKKKGQFLLSER